MMRPSKIVCVGLNYRDHADEGAVEAPDAPLLFAKWPNTLLEDGGTIVIPPEVTQCDWEAELGVVIGATASRVDAGRALEVVAGYVALNDVTARDLQFSEGQWTRGKSVDTFCPVGEMKDAAEVGDPQNLRVRSWVNGELMQDATTADMIFGVAEIIAHVTRTVTLEPGDLIATGTPAGVGAFRDPPRFLDDGDVVEVEVEGVGRISNPVARQRA